MPGIIRALTDYRNPFSILTKGTLILRDLELLVEAAGSRTFRRRSRSGRWTRTPGGRASPAPRTRVRASTPFGR
jgi:hypothetical protein